MYRIIIVLILSSITFAADDIDVTKIPSVATAIATYNKTAESSEDTAAKIIEKANKDNEDRKIVAKKRLILSVRQAAATSKDSKAILEYADTLEKEGQADLPNAKMTEPIRMKIHQEFGGTRGDQFVTDIKKGQTITVKAEGKWRVDGSNDSVTDADGRPDKNINNFKFPGGSLCGIFKDGENPPLQFFVGSTFSKKFNSDGKLYLFGNGNHDSSGEIDVIVVVGGTRTTEDQPVKDKRAKIIEEAKKVIGKWDIKVYNGFRSVWKFTDDGKVASTNGAHDGQWKIDFEKSRIYIVWGGKEEQWETLDFPLDPKGVAGHSWLNAGDDHAIEAKKQP